MWGEPIAIFICDASRYHNDRLFGFRMKILYDEFGKITSEAKLCSTHELITCQFKQFFNAIPERIFQNESP